MRPRIRKMINGVHMGLGHDGLAKLIFKETGLDVRKLEQGDIILLMNTKGDKLKMLGGAGLVIGYLKMPNGRKLMKEALQYIPETFGGAGFDYDKACLKVMRQRIPAYIPTALSA